MHRMHIEPDPVLPKDVISKLMEYEESLAATDQRWVEGRHEGMAVQIGALNWTVGVRPAGSAVEMTITLLNVWQVSHHEERKMIVDFCKSLETAQALSRYFQFQFASFQSDVLEFTFTALVSHTEHAVEAYKFCISSLIASKCDLTLEVLERAYQADGIPYSRSRQALLRTVHACAEIATDLQKLDLMFTASNVSFILDKHDSCFVGLLGIGRRTLVIGRRLGVLSNDRRAELVAKVNAIRDVDVKAWLFSDGAYQSASGPVSCWEDELTDQPVLYEAFGNLPGINTYESILFMPLADEPTGEELLQSIARLKKIAAPVVRSAGS